MGATATLRTAHWELTVQSFLLEFTFSEFFPVAAGSQGTLVSGVFLIQPAEELEGGRAERHLPAASRITEGDSTGVLARISCRCHQPCAQGIRGKQPEYV